MTVQSKSSTPRLAPLLVPALLTLGSCGGPEVPEPLRIAGADPQRGAQAIANYGCGACHQIPGVPGARGLVGPPLDQFAGRGLIAGKLPNRPPVLVSWIIDPPALIPATGMPDIGVSPQDARDIAAYLYSLESAETFDWPPPVPPDRPRFDAPKRPD